MKILTLKKDFVKIACRDEASKRFRLIAVIACFLFLIASPAWAYSRNPADSKVYEDITFDFVAIDFCDPGENWKFSLYHPNSGIAYLFAARATTSAIASLSCGDSYCTNGIGCNDFVCPWNLYGYTVQAICTTDAVGVVSGQYEPSSQQNPDNFIIYDSSDICAATTTPAVATTSSSDISVITSISSDGTTIYYYVPFFLFITAVVLIAVFLIIFIIFWRYGHNA